MDTDGPINPASGGIYHNYVIVDHFSKYIINVPTPKKKGPCALNSVVHHWISIFGPPQNLITDNMTGYLNTESAKCCTLLKKDLFSNNFKSSDK